MANPRLTRWLLLACVAFSPAAGWCTGGYFEDAPPTLPYYLDRLPAKPPSLIFEETFGGPTAPPKPVDFKAALLGLAGDCEKGVPPAKLIATTDDLLGQARLDPFRAAALSNILNDVRDLFSAPAPVTGKLAAGYIRWRVEHADWFHIAWDKPKPVVPDEYAEDVDKVAQGRLDELEANLKRCEADPASKPLCAHWLFLCGAIDFPAGGGGQFKEVVEMYPDSPRAEAARFLLARCVFNASRSHGDGDGANSAAAEDRKQAKAMFEDYLKRYPQGRFVADVPGWLGAIAFLDGDYLGALDLYLQQADMPGHPEVLKSAGFMCERCLARLAVKGDQAALDKVADHPRLAMSLIYLVVNSPQVNGDDDKTYTPAQVNRWRRALLPRLADAVAAHADGYKSGDWQPRYLALLAQAASGCGDQAKALSLCDMGKDHIAHCDDLAFIRLVALERAHKLPEAIAAGREFAHMFPKSPLASGAALRTALALQDNHQAGAAIGELLRLQNAIPDAKKDEDESEEAGGGSTQLDAVYPYADGNLPASQSSVQRDVSGAETAQLAQLIDTLLNFAPLPELAAAPMDGADAANLRAVLVQRWLAEEENFAEAKKYATPAQWSVAAEALAQLTAAAYDAPAGSARAAACAKVAEAWAARRGQIVFAPLETDDCRTKLFHDDAKAAGVARRKNGLALGISAKTINQALSTRDEWQHAFAWQLKAADAAPEQSPERAKALWAALRMMPAMALASPYTFLRAGETDATAFSRHLYDRLRRECPQSREARELAVYYDLTPPPAAAPEDAGSADSGDADDKEPPQPDLSAASGDDLLPYGELEYRWTAPEEDNGQPAEDPGFGMIQSQAIALNSERYLRDPNLLRREVATLRAKLRGMNLRRIDTFLVNYLDDLGDFLDEPDAKHTPEILAKYVPLRVECLSVEHWEFWPGDGGLPPVPGATPETLNETFRKHIHAAYQTPALAQIHDYLDFLGLALVANSNIAVPIPGEIQDAKDGSGTKEPVTYQSRDYEKLAKLAEGFLMDYPHSRKRDAARLLEARALSALYRPQMYMKWAAWPESGHFASGNLLFSSQPKAVDAKRVGAALNGYDREFPNGRYAADIRNLRGMLAWRTQDWPRALALTLQTLDDKNEPVLQNEAAKRLYNIFMDGLRDETERAHLIAAVKACPGAPQKLRDFVPTSAYPVKAMGSWILAQLGP
jgi:outer membrane protein assembly factor BamD (BamD/ComL family)